MKPLLSGAPVHASRPYMANNAGWMHELSEVATLAIVTNGFDRVQSRRVVESGLADYMEGAFVSEKLDLTESPTVRSLMRLCGLLGWKKRGHKF